MIGSGIPIEPSAVARWRDVTSALGIVALLGCSGNGTASSSGATWQGPAQGVDASSGTEAEKFFPMKDGTLYHYRTEALREGPVGAGMLIMKVHRASSTRAELRKPTGNQSFEFTSAGIATVTKTGAPAFLLKLPLDQTHSWLGPQGGKTRIEALGVTLETPAGTFNGCIQTLEERGGDAPMRVKTTLCPDVGITALEVQSGAAVERAQLMYFGPPIDVGPEGLQRVQ